MRKIEILAPAGSRASLEAAVKAGADAVYLAGQQFGARKSAQNFSQEELIEVIGYCHLRGVRVYLTVNTLLSDNEIGELEAYLKPLYEHGIDAFIVQDFGVFSLLRRAFPEIEIHCSTQMALRQSSDFALMKTLGASRVVVPRELSVQEIRRIKDQVNIEIEAFVHGALCVSVSGQCLMSSMIGGRSGNRGSCAQSCRQKYTLISGSQDEKVVSKDGDYLLSPKDLMTLDRLEEIIDAGVDSLKIEGRMKGPEYTFAVTRAYREALDQILIKRGEMAKAQAQSGDAAEEIRRIFNREFTEGFILGAGNKAYIGQETPGNRGIPVAKCIRYNHRDGEVVLELLKDLNKGDDIQVRSENTVGGRVEYIKYNGQRVENAKAGMEVVVNFKHELKPNTIFYRTYDQVLMKNIQMGLNDLERRTGVALNVTMKIGEPMVLTMTHDCGKSVRVETEQLVEKALKTPLSNERLLEQLEKMGGTPFVVSQTHIERLGDETLPIKAINQLRRDAVDQLTELIVGQYGRTIDRLSSCENEEKSTDASPLGLPTGEGSDLAKPLALSAMVRSPEQFQAAVSLGLKRIYIHNLFDGLEAEFSEWEEVLEQAEDLEIWAYLGRFVDTQTVDHRLATLNSIKSKIKGVLAATVGQALRAEEEGYKVQGDFSLNIFNHESAKFTNALDLSSWTYSLELNEGQLEVLQKKHSQAFVSRETEIIGFGLMPVMVNEYCTINGVYSKDKAGCQLCRKNNYYLEDKTGACFLVKGDRHCQVEIFNANVLNLADEWPAIEAMGINYYRLNFVNETYDETIEAIETHLKAALGYPVELKGKGFTKGHFKRGVL